MPRGRSTRNDQELAARRHRAAEMYLHGHTQADIARTLRVSQGVVSEDLAAVREMWARQSVADFNTAKMMELARIDWVEREAAAAWERSKKPAETLTEKSSDAPAAPAEGQEGQTPAPPPVERTRKKEYRDGNPEYLKAIAKCIDQRCRIWGFDAAKKLELLGHVSVVTEGGPPGGLDPADLVAVMALAEKAGRLGPEPQGGGNGNGGA